MISTDRSGSLASLLLKLSEGWNTLQSSSIQAFLQIWEERFASSVVREIGEGYLYCVTDLPGVHVLGADDVHFALFAGNSSDKETLQQWRRRVSAPRRLLLAIAFSKAPISAARELLSDARGLVLSPNEAQKILEAPFPAAELAKALRGHLPIRSLIPYNYLRPAAGRLFFGRRHELERLLREDDVSFAIAGPGRIGKTSLVHQYQKLLLKSRDVRALRLVEIDLYPCANAPSQDVARFVAMKIDPSRRSSRMTADKLIDFMRYQHHQRGGALELILDEVDGVCRSAAFEAIGEAAKQGLCRLVVCGRGRLFEMLLSQDSPLSCRLELLRPGPLEEEDARALLLLPLRDLGVEIERADEIMRKVCSLSGRLPHLVQFYGKKIAELVAEQEITSLTVEMVDELSWDMDSAHFVTSPLRGLDDGVTLQLALALLRERPTEVTRRMVRDIADKFGLPIRDREIGDRLNDLVMNNILSWRRGLFFLSTEALPMYATHLGYLDGIPAARPMQSVRHGSAGEGTSR
jgi:hypothetical protein